MICFPEDSRKYTEFFIDNKWDGGNCVTQFDGDVLINMLFLVKKKMVVRGEIFDFPYMVAGGTRPEYRGKGIFTQVLLETMESFQKSGKFPLTGLMPSAHSFYYKQNYVTHSFYEERSLKKKGNLPIKEISFKQIPEIVDIYNDYMKDKSGWFVRGREECDLRLREVFEEGGRAYGLYENGKMNGYILTFDDEEIEEYCAREKDYINKFDTPFESYCVNVGSNGAEENMIRVCDNKTLLSRIKYDNKINETIKIEVIDNFHRSNSGKYEVAIANGVGRVCECQNAEYVLSINQFSKLVMGCYQNDEFDQRLTKVFPVMLNCALEKF